MRLTGGEPLLRAGLDRLVAMLAAAGAADLALTTNGQRLAEMAGPLKQAGLNRINISLDSLSPATFAAITRGGILEKTLAGIAAARRAGLDPVKLNMVVMRGENDHEVADLVRFAVEHGCQMRFLELMPIGVAAAGFEDRFVSSAEVLERLAGEFALTELPVDPRSTSRNFVAEDQSGRWTTIGFISPSSQPFCAGCRRLRLTAAGVLLGCLARPTGIPIAPLLRSGSELDAEALVAAVEQALGMKRIGQRVCAAAGDGGNRGLNGWGHAKPPARFWLREAAGSLGDFGTFVPLAVGMVLVAGLDAGTLLVTAGLANIWGGLAFGIPIAAQPMKAICALAIAGALSGKQAVVAGLFVAVAMALLGLLGLIRSFARLVPDAVLRALQLTVACELLLSGLRFGFAGVSGEPGSDGRRDGRAVAAAPPAGMGGDRSAGGGTRLGRLAVARVAERAAVHVVAASLDAVRSGVARRNLASRSAATAAHVVELGTGDGGAGRATLSATGPAHHAHAHGSFGRVHESARVPAGRNALVPRLGRAGGPAQTWRAQWCFGYPSGSGEVVLGPVVRRCGRAVDESVSAAGPRPVPVAGRLVAGGSEPRVEDANGDLGECDDGGC